MHAETQQRVGDAAFQQAFLRNEREVRIRTGKLACALAAFLMPLGVALDYFVYPADIAFFFKLRLVCSALVCVVWGLHYTPFGLRHYRWIGFPIVFLPSLFIALMIACTQTPASSPYYAGLNLILLAVSAVGHWTAVDTFISVVGVMEFYFIACYVRPLPSHDPSFISNVYFLSLTGIIVITGNYLYNKLLLREFELRYELAENRRLLEENNRKLVELDKVKSRFFANISHELRTPLTLLIGPLEILWKEGDRLSPTTTRAHLETMWSHGLRLLKLINDLLDLVRLESGKMEIKPEPTRVAEFARGLANSLQAAAADKRIQLECVTGDNLGVALIDRDKLEKILLNLVYNALKFTPAGGTVALNVRKEGGSLLFEVCDTGIGIAAEHLPFVFDRFWQADTSASRKYQGTGIGLALVRELVEIQGGAVRVESVLSAGTRFIVQLPCHSATEQEGAKPYDIPERPAHEARAEDAEYDRIAGQMPQSPLLESSLRDVEVFLDPNKPSVLIADDEPDMLQFLASQLRQRFQVLEAVDGQQALDKACQFMPDVIVLDMMMPEMDGLQVCRELRSRTPTQSLPILLLTARADEETKLAALGAGAHDFLSKPFSTTELLVRTQNLAKSHHLQKTLSQQNQRLEAALEQLKETQTQLFQNEKLASLGKLSAGIIHEINNPLNYANTGAFNLRGFVEHLPAAQQTDYEEVLKDVTEGLQRIKQIVSDLRTFTHPDARRRSRERVRRLIETSLRMLAREWRDRVEIEVEADENLEFDVNGNQVIQVLINLEQNAIDALREARTPDPRVRITARQSVEHTVITVRDNGPGISPENLGRIFDPFFTTKQVGAGMGLGLSISFSILQQHGGRILAQSRLGEFTEFTLEFPRLVAEFDHNPVNAQRRMP